MYLSPLTWGTSEMLTDFSRDHTKSPEKVYQSNFKAKRVSLAKQRNEEPKFVTIVHKITALYPPPPYFPNPLAHDAACSRLGGYVSRHFLWDHFPQDVDIGEGRLATVTTTVAATAYFHCYTYHCNYNYCCNCNYCSCCA